MAPKRQASLKATKALTTKKRPIQSKKTATRKPDDEAVLEELRQFDLCSRYGPNAGISRQERWDRAARLGKAPPASIHRYLQDGGLRARLGEEAVLQPLWHSIL